MTYTETLFILLAWTAGLGIVMGTLAWIADVVLPFFFPSLRADESDRV